MNRKSGMYWRSIPRRSRISKRCVPQSAIPYAVLGHATDDGVLTVDDTHFDNQPIALPLQVLLGKPPKMTRTRESRQFCPGNR